jgi:hypothetical protein
MRPLRGPLMMCRRLGLFVFTVSLSRSPANIVVGITEADTVVLAADSGVALGEQGCNIYQRGDRFIALAGPPTDANVRSLSKLSPKQIAARMSDSRQLWPVEFFEFL